MELDQFKSKLKQNQEKITFDETMATVEHSFDFTPTAFQNGELHNEVGQNSGSCKLFAFAKHEGFTEQETLHCFGDYYRVDVLEDIEGASHQNIRNFIKHGWEGISFENEALQIKK